MKGEIDKNFYCSADVFNTKGTNKKDSYCSYADTRCRVDYCQNSHRKHPTPEQFKEEYGFEWTGAVYSHCCDSNNGDYSDCISEKCKYFGWGDGEEYGCLIEPITVCASTPFGKPDDNWRPE